MAENKNKLHEGTLSKEATMKFEFQNPTRLVFGGGTQRMASGRDRLAIPSAHDRACIVRPPRHHTRGGAGSAQPGVDALCRQGVPARFVRFAQRIFGLTARRADDAGCAREAVDRFEAFLRCIGCPTHLSELHIGEAMLPRYAQDTVRIVHDQEGRLPGRPPMKEADIVEVLRSAL
jgi:alcohol dehydrogenase YqhD (iron-dependent ADH family)